MKTINTVSSLMELAESRNNITASSNEGDSQEEFHAEIKITMGHWDGTKLGSMTNFSDIVAAYNKGAKITASAYITGMIYQPLIINALIQSAVYNNTDPANPTIIGFIFKQITDGQQKTFNINTLNWNNDNTATITATSYIPDIPNVGQQPMNFYITEQVTNIDSEGKVTTTNNNYGTNSKVMNLYIEADNNDRYFFHPDKELGQYTQLSAQRIYELASNGSIIVARYPNGYHFYWLSRAYYSDNKYTIIFTGVSHSLAMDAVNGTVDYASWVSNN